MTDRLPQDEKEREALKARDQVDHFLLLRIVPHELRRIGLDHQIWKIVDTLDTLTGVVLQPPPLSGVGVYLHTYLPKSLQRSQKDLVAPLPGQGHPQDVVDHAIHHHRQGGQYLLARERWMSDRLLEAQRGRGVRFLISGEDPYHQGISVKAPPQGVPLLRLTIGTPLDHLHVDTPQARQEGHQMLDDEPPLLLEKGGSHLAFHLGISPQRLRNGVESHDRQELTYHPIQQRMILCQRKENPTVIILLTRHEKMKEIPSFILQKRKLLFAILRQAHPYAPKAPQEIHRTQPTKPPRLRSLRLGLHHSLFRVLKATLMTLKIQVTTKQMSTIMQVTFHH